MFRAYEKQHKLATFVLVVACIPTDELQSERSWSHDLLMKLSEALEISDQNVSAYMPLVESHFTKASCSSIQIDQRNTLIRPYLAILSESTYSSLQTYMNILLTLVQSNKFDGRGRALMRNIACHMSISSRDTVHLEFVLAQCLLEIQEEVLRKKEESKGGRRRVIRYAKIGVAAAGAGVLLAFTGGLVSFSGRGPITKKLYCFHLKKFDILRFCNIFLSGY